MKRQLHPKRIQAMRANARIRAAMRFRPTRIIIGEASSDTVAWLSAQRK